MSTRRTLWHNDVFQLYSDGFDDESVYLEVRSEHLRDLVIKIPLEVWKEMRQHTIQPAERYLDLNDDELRQEAEHEVDQHRAWLEENPDLGYPEISASLSSDQQGLVTRI